MPYTITGSVTYSSQTNRDAALSRVTTALSGVDWSAFATPTLPAGILSSGTLSITVSIVTLDGDSLAASTMKSILDAFVSSNRHTSGFLAVNKT